ncbi:hypothetical protein K439DRAFT_776672 [Ramaria rubella]|nr:hypothetical protein K439DRAFT_776672 [Ramaria rubella]
MHREFIYSLHRPWTHLGIQIMTQDGIILHDEVDQFAANGIVPMLVLVEDLKTGQLGIVTGAAEGLRTITTVRQCLSHQLDQKTRHQSYSTPSRMPVNSDI